MGLLSVLLWLVHPVSIIRSFMLRFNKRIPVFNVDQEQRRISRDFNTIQKYGLLSLVVIILYLLIIVIILGWTFRWYFISLIIHALLFLTLDRYLIAVNYGKTFVKKLPQHLKAKITVIRLASYGYMFLRVCYLVWGIIFLGIFTGDTMESFLYKGYAIAKNNPKVVKKYPFGSDISTASNFFSTSYFNGDLILYYNGLNPGQLYLFKSKLFVFMEYANPDFRVGLSGDPDLLQFDKNTKTLYLAPYGGELKAGLPKLVSTYRINDTLVKRYIVWPSVEDIVAEQSKRSKIVRSKGIYYYYDYSVLSTDSTFYDIQQRQYVDTIKNSVQLLRHIKF